MSLLAVLFAVRAFSVARMIIPDCDETYNYWDPLNFMLRGFGKQTWEYSPEYAIRSWAYLGGYAAAVAPLRALFGDDNLFYLVRAVIALVTVAGEYKLYRSIKRNFGTAPAKWALLFSATSTGMAHAGVELLPSAFAMQTQMFAVSAALDGNYLTSVVWQLLGGLLGWPFALSLGIPVGVVIVLRQRVNDIVGTVVALGAICGSIMAIDSYLYGRLVLVPWNIVKYNVFSGDDGVGPDIFGTEPWWYYPVNLVLNYHGVAGLGYLGALVNCAFYKVERVWLVSAPLVIWSAIFFSQPHKEERFLYPIYPLIAANAGLLVASMKLPKVLKIVAAIGATVVSLLRTLALVTHYSAPLTVMSAFNSTQPAVVCMGKEWYHFPTSMLLPANHRIEYIESGFDGLLPGSFEETGMFKDKVSQIPQGMNNRNEFDPSKLVPVNQCDYFIESGPVDDEWKSVVCASMIDPSKPQGLGRLVWLPNRFGKVESMDYCIYQRKSD